MSRRGSSAPARRGRRADSPRDPSRGSSRGSARKNTRKGSRRTSKPTQAIEDSRYLVLWKPYDVLSQFTSPETSDARTLKELVDVPDVYAAGRLDRDSEGLLLLTDDGLFQHKLCDPRYVHWRTYLVQVERTPTPAALRALREGVSIRGRMTLPARVELLSEPPRLPDRIPPIRSRRSIETAWLKLSLTEGLNRQVRRMTAAVGFPTLRLVRAEIELTPEVTLDLSGLEPGEHRALTPRELSAVKRVRDKVPTPEREKKR